MPNSFTSIMEYYGTNSSSYTPTNQDSGWSTTIPSQYAYIWFRVVTNDGSGTTVTSEPLLYSSPGPSDSGSPVASTTTQYYGTNTENDPPGQSATWSTTIPSGYTYIWSRVVILYTDGTSYTTEPVLETSDEDVGPKIDNIAVQYYGTDSESYVPDENTEWSLTEPTGVAYIWTRSITTYADGTTEVSIPQRESADSDDDNPVVSTTTQYYGTDDETLVPDNSSAWTTTRPTGYIYIWFRVITQYQNGDTTITDPQLETPEQDTSNPVVSVTSVYFGTNDETFVPDATTIWSNTIPSSYSYIWVKTTTTYNDGTYYIADPIMDPTLSQAIPVVPEDTIDSETQEGDGDNETIPEEAPPVDMGNEIVSTVNQYYGTNDSSVTPDDTYEWLAIAPQTFEYLWVRTVTTYEDGTVVKSTPVIDLSGGERAPAESMDPDASFTPPGDPSQSETDPMVDAEEPDLTHDPITETDILITAEDFVLSQTQVFNALTANGAMDGLYMGSVTYTDPDTGEEVTEPQLFVNADFIRSGTLQLGGANNEFGIAQILDDNNRVISQWDRTGFTVTADVNKSSNLDLFSIKRKNQDGTYTKYLTITEDGELVLLGSSVMMSLSLTSGKTLPEAMEEVDEAIEQVEEAADAAQASADTANTAATQALTNAATAQSAANAASQAASNAHSAATAAQGSANTALQNAATAQSAANAAQVSATQANTAANDALSQTSIIEDVLGTLNWISDHGTYALTTDTAINPDKVYFEYDGTSYTVVSDPDVADISSYYELTINEAVTNYIASHLSLTNAGLWVTKDANSYKILIASDGVRIYDGQGHLVSTYGESIVFDSSRPQYIGGQNAYIMFYDANNDGVPESLKIAGASIELGSTETLDQAISGLQNSVENTLIYDHDYVVQNGVATFTAYLYRAGVDVKTDYDPTDFSWYYKTEDRQTLHPLGTGYQCTVNLSDMGYGGHVIGHFTTTSDSELLTSNDDLLTDSNDNSITARTPTGETVRISDLTVSTTIYPSDKLIVSGLEDEHLVSIASLQEYLDANLTKQVRFGTTSYWDSQISTSSEANTIYIYTDHIMDSVGNVIAGIKVGDGNAYVADLPFTDSVMMSHIADSTIHITSSERAFWNNKVSCYYAGTNQLVFTTS